MKTKHITTRFGGEVTEIAAVGHDTEGGVGYWFFIGTSRFKDCGEKKSTFGPQDIYCDSSIPEAKAELDTIMGAMNAYLLKAGSWHDMKHKRDGRCYSWTPKKPHGSENIEKMIDLAAKKKEAA